MGIEPRYGLNIDNIRDLHIWACRGALQLVMPVFMALPEKGLNIYSLILITSGISIYRYKGHVCFILITGSYINLTHVSQQLVWRTNRHIHGDQGSPCMDIKGAYTSCSPVLTSLWHMSYQLAWCKRQDRQDLQVFRVKSNLRLKGYSLIWVVLCDGRIWRHTTAWHHT